MNRILTVVAVVCVLGCLGCSEDQGAGLGKFCEKDGDCSGELVCRNNICVVKPLECEPACDPLAETCVEGQCVPVGDPNDKDGDGSPAGDDCNDFDRTIHPGAHEYCDGVNNDCDDVTDEDCPACVDGFVQDCGTDVGECIQGTQACAAGKWAECSGTGVAIELCDGKDNDCDGLTDEVCPCTDGDQQPCGLDEGNCVAGTELCEGGAWSGCRGGELPQQEICDGIDNDCDGITDDGFMIGQACEGVGECGAGTIECADTTSVRCSTNPGGSQYAGVDEVCDFKDNDCDGSTDEGCPYDLESCPESSFSETDLEGSPNDKPEEFASSTCPPGQVVIGLRVRSGDYLDAVGVMCGIPRLDPDPAENPLPDRIVADLGENGDFIGGSGGAGFDTRCDSLSPDFPFLSIIQIRYSNEDPTPWIAIMKFACQGLDVNESSGTFLVERTDDTVISGYYGNPNGVYTDQNDIACPDNQVPYGIEGHAGDYVDNLRLLCCDIDLVLKE